MKKIKQMYFWWNGLTKRLRDSIVIPTVAIGFISSVFTILGISLSNCECLNFGYRFGIVFGGYIISVGLVYYLLGAVFKDSVSLMVRQTAVSISYGDIFQVSAWRVVGCDTHFDTRVDDIVISKASLHGQLFLKHGKVDEIAVAIEAEAKRLGLEKNSNGTYDFPLGTIIRYDSSIDNATYLLLAMIELDSDYEAHTNMDKFEHTLMRMWEEISRVYNKHDIALPVLGDGITRFDDGPKGSENLLRCMLCTLNSSGVIIKSNVKILLYNGDENKKNISLYEYKNLFSEMRGIR